MKDNAIKFSVPFNGDLTLMDWAIKSGKTYEIYFAGEKANNFSSPLENNNKYSHSTLTSLVKLCNRNNIKTNLLLNKSILLTENKIKVGALIKKIMEMGILNSVTVADPFVIPFLRQTFPHLEIQCSVYMGINSAQKAIQALKKGISVLNLEPSLNRNFNQLKAIKALKKQFPNFYVKLLGNHICYSDCMYYVRHSQIADLKISTKNKNNAFLKNAHIFKCHYEIQSRRDEITRPLIRPEDVGYYEKNELADYIKIAFRNNETPTLFRKINAYFNKSYAGDLFELFDSNNSEKLVWDNKKVPINFIEKVMLCDKNCNRCRYCDRIAKKTLFNAEESKC
ncbi:MAG: hypothetical protein ABIC68_01050 [Candidatus Omnitrophota bacterium]